MMKRVTLRTVLPLAIVVVFAVPVSAENRAADFRAAVQAQAPGATVIARTRNSITHRLPNGRVVIDTSIAPIHTAGLAEINTAWQATTGTWQHQMTQADYEARAKSAFNGAPLVEYRVGTEFVTLQPRQLEWTNDRGDVQVAGGVAAVTATVSGDRLTWTGAYGAGRDFVYQLRSSKLSKQLIVASYASFPAPSAQILGGANPVLRMGYQFAWSATVTPYVDGVPWTGAAGSPTLTAASAIEFRRVDQSVAFRFETPKAYPTQTAGENPDAPNVRMQVRRTGPNILVEVLVPQPWLQSATYPVVVDPTIDVSVGASSDDALQSGTSMFLSLTGTETDLTTHYQCFRFTGITITAGSTITTSYMTLYVATSTGDEPNHTFFAQDAATTATFTTTASDCSDRPDTTATAVWSSTDLGAPGSFNTVSLNSIIQELLDSYSYSSGTMVLVNQGSGDSSRDLNISLWDHASDPAPALHIEYTEPAAGGRTNLTLLGVACVVLPTLWLGRRRRAALILALVLVPTSLSAATYYVDQNHGSASDSNAGTSESAPWLTLHRAVDGIATREVGGSGGPFTPVVAGDTVYVKNGTYTDNTSFTPGDGVIKYNPTNSGTAGNPIAFRAYPGHAPVVDRQKNAGEWVNHPVIGADGRSYIIWDGFTTASETNVLTQGGADNIILERLIINLGSCLTVTSGNRAGIFIFITSTFVTVRNNTISNVCASGGPNINAAGILTYDSHDVTIHNNNLIDNDQGIFMKRNAMRFEVYNNWIYSSQDNGISINTQTSGACGACPVEDNNIHNNVIVGPSTNKCLNLNLSTADASFDDNDFYNNTCWNQTLGGVSWFDLSGVAGLRIYNNIFDRMGSNTFAQSQGTFPGTGLLSDFNVLRSSTIGTHFQATINGASENLATWQARTGTPDVNSLTGDPLFVGPTTTAAGYKLQAGSPARDAGREGGTSGGAVTTIGAYQTGNECIGLESACGTGGRLPRVARRFRVAGLIYQVPFAHTLVGACVMIDSDAAWDLVLYDSDGTTELKSVTFDSDIRPSNAGHETCVKWTETAQLNASTNYRVVVRPSTTTGVILSHITVNSAAYLGHMSGGTNFHWTQQINDSGSWTETTTKRPMIELLIEDVLSE